MLYLTDDLILFIREVSLIHHVVWCRNSRGESRSPLGLLRYFTRGRGICVDESTIKFKDRISFIIYNPKKPTKWSIRVYTMADSSTGLTMDKLIRSDLPIWTTLPLHLYAMLLETISDVQEYHMFTDRYYTSYILEEELLKLKYHLTGTILTNRSIYQNK